MTARHEPPRRCLCTAEAFGFGPASKLLALLRCISRETFTELSFVGHGCAHELCSTGSFDRIIRADPGELGPGSLMEQELGRHDVFISAMEFQPLSTARAMGLRTVVFDSLLWMWPHLPCRLEDVDLYLCQNFVGVAARRASVGAHSGIVVVPPLTESSPGEWAPGQRVLLNFGGMDNPHASRREILSYAIELLGIVESVASPERCPLAACGRGWVMDELAKVFRASHIDFYTLSPWQFSRELRRARCLITSPGLEVLYEAFTAGVPTFLLPAQNNSQVYQADILLREIENLPGVQWHELMATDLLGDDQSPEHMIREALRCAFRLSADDRAQRLLGDALAAFLAKSPDDSVRQRREQWAFVEGLRRESDLALPELRSRIADLLNAPLRP